MDTFNLLIIALATPEFVFFFFQSYRLLRRSMKKPPGSRGPGGGLWNLALSVYFSLHEA
jgi:hypothetical protein